MRAAGFFADPVSETEGGKEEMGKERPSIHVSAMLQLANLCLKTYAEPHATTPVRVILLLAFKEETCSKVSRDTPSGSLSLGCHLF